MEHTQKTNKKQSIKQFFGLDKIYCKFVTAWWRVNIHVERTDVRGRWVVMETVEIQQKYSNVHFLNNFHKDLATKK